MADPVSRPNPLPVRLSLAVLAPVGLILSLWASDRAASQTARERPQPTPAADTVYLWNPPAQGFQTVVTLNPVEDSLTLEVGLLFPTRIRVEGLEVVAGKEAEAKKAFGELAVGKLMTASLNGKDADGTAKGDLWDGAQKGYLKSQMLKTGFWREAKPAAPKQAVPRVTP